MRWKQAGAAAVAVGALLVGLAGCARPLKEQVVGKWQKVGGGAAMTFLKDGTFTMTGGPLTLSGSYTTPDEKHLKVQVSGVAGNLIGAQVREAEVKDGKLILVDGSNREEYTRVP